MGGSCRGGTSCARRTLLLGPKLHRPRTTLLITLSCSVHKHENVYTFNFQIYKDHIIPKNLTCSNSATKSLRTHSLSGHRRSVGFGLRHAGREVRLSYLD